MNPLILVGSDSQIHASLPLMVDTVVSSWENNLMHCPIAGWQPPRALWQ